MTENSNQNDKEPKNESSSSSSSSPGPPPPSTLDSSSNETTPPPSPSSSSLVLGKAVANASDWINDNLITVRYSVMATIGLLTFYGMSQTPLFFRYVNVSEIPVSKFVQQKSLSCRLIQIHKQQQQESTRMFKKQGSFGKRQHPSSSSSSSSQQNHHHQAPIRMWVRHLSPVESWLFLSVLPTSWFDWYMKMHPQQAIKNRQRRPDQNNKQDLLLVQVAGIDAPLSSSYYGSSSTPWLTGTEWIQKNLLEKQQSTLLTCQLLERQRLPRLHPAEENVIEDEDDEDEELDIAVVKVYFRQPNSFFQLFSTDLAHYMVRNGIANPASFSSEATEAETISIRSRNNTVTAADEEKLKQRQRRRYQEMLQRAEMDAAKESRGMWSDPIVQQERRHVMDEVEFQTTASTRQKLWRWIQQTWQQRRRQVKEKEQKSRIENVIDRKQ